MKLAALLPIFLAWAALASPGQAETAAHTIAYHSQDIVNIRAKVKYTTLIQLPNTEKIIEAATGDKEFWIIDVVGSFCFVHPAKAGIRSNLNLITDKGNIYSFTLEDVSNENADPDLKVIVQPADRSSIAASTGAAQFVPVSQVTAVQEQLQALQSRIVQTIDQYKDSYRGQLKFDYHYKQNEAPFNIASIFHDDRFTYIKSDAQEKFTLYEVRDGAPNLINYDLKDGTYVIPKVLDRGYVEIREIPKSLQGAFCLTLLVEADPQYHENGNEQDDRVPQLTQKEIDCSRAYQKQ